MINENFDIVENFVSYLERERERVMSHRMGDSLSPRTFEEKHAYPRDSIRPLGYRRVATLLTRHRGAGIRDERDEWRTGRDGNGNKEEEVARENIDISRYRQMHIPEQRRNSERLVKDMFAYTLLLLTDNCKNFN